MKNPIDAIVDKVLEMRAESQRRIPAREVITPAREKSLPTPPRKAPGRVIKPDGKDSISPGNRDSTG